MRKTKTRITKGNGNVFADLELPNPEQELLKARLPLQIYRIVKAYAQPRWKSLGRPADGIPRRARPDLEIPVKPTRKDVGAYAMIRGPSR
jgi:hypothetical protein